MTAATLLTRRHLLTGAACLLAAPAIVRAASLMPVSAPRPDYWMVEWPQPWTNNVLLRLSTYRRATDAEIRIAKTTGFWGGLSSHKDGVRFWCLATDKPA